MLPSRLKKTGAGNIALLVFWIAAGLYIADIVLGKLHALWPDLTPSLPLGEVAQFLLLMAVSVFLVVAALAAEARQDGRDASSEQSIAPIAEDHHETS